MILAKYISDLLYRYECVIVPDFGGFVTNEVSAKVNHYTYTFYAPSKQLTFNTHLQNNDGLLANYMATAENISYAKAVKCIEKEVRSWKETIREEELELDNIGSFHLNKKGQFIFEPKSTINYLTSSFGLSSFVSPAVKRISYKQKVKQLETIAPVVPIEEHKRKTPAFIKYAAAAAIVLAIGTIGWKEYQTTTYNKLVAEAADQQQKVDKSIQEATFVISNPLPAITLNVVKETYNYHVIAGAFREPLNAQKKLQQLLKNGYKARILAKNKWNLTPVAYQSFNSRTDAINSLNSIKKIESKDAWLLILEY